MADDTDTLPLVEACDRVELTAGDITLDMVKA